MYKSRYKVRYRSLCPARCWLVLVGRQGSLAPRTVRQLLAFCAGVLWPRRRLPSMLLLLLPSMLLLLLPPMLLLRPLCRPLPPSGRREG